jgi:hypothetical protein
MNDCQSIRQHLADMAMDPQLKETEAVCAHLKICTVCQRFQTQLVAQGEALDDLSHWVEQDMGQRQDRAIAAFHEFAASTPPAIVPLHSPKWTQLAVAAAVLVVAGMIVLLMDGSLDPAGVSFARVEQAFNQAPWLHIVMKGDHRTESELREVWAGFNSGILAAKKVGGRIDYIDLSAGKEYQYDPQGRDLQVVGVRLDRFGYDLGSPSAFLQSILRSYAHEGADLTDSIGLYAGQPVRIFTAKHTYAHGDCTLEVFVNPATHLPCAGRETWQGRDQAPQITEIEVGYPTEGPSSIYDLGVPVLTGVQDQTHIKKQKPLFSN